MAKPHKKTRAALIKANQKPGAVEVCIYCGRPVSVMAHRGTGYCSGLCKKADSGD